MIDRKTSPEKPVTEESATTRAHASFADFATLVARWTGNHWAFLVAAALVVMSLVLFGVEITNIAISIGTLLMVFILQNTQNRDSAALHLKLDEMVRVEPAARDDVRGVESRPAQEIDDLHLQEPDGSRV
ncbi:MAG: low affinity iron permease family protein [Pseudonocardiaceae bacterium]